MKKYISEIVLTTDFVDEAEWLKFILSISKLNGLFRSWKIYIKIERNVIRYYIITKRKMPTILNCTGNFLIRNIENFKRIKTNLEFLYWVTNKEKNIIDICEKNEIKYRQKLEQIEIKIRPYNGYNYLTKTKLFFQNNKGRKSKGRALFFIPHSSLSIDYSKHTRFSYTKEGTRYLNLQKSIHLFQTNNKTENLVEINTFPYSRRKILFEC